MFDHPLWRHRPAHTAYRLLTCLVRQRVPGLSDAVVSHDDGRSRIVVDVRTRFGYGIYRYGHHDPDIDFIRGLLAPGDIFVDGGAHIGLFSLAAAARVGPKGCVIAFEPAARTRASLIRNVALNGFHWIDVRTEALSDRPGEREFFSFPVDSWGSSSFAPPGDLPDAERGVVVTTTLDEALRGLDAGRIRLVKLDLEGAELAALCGATDLLASAHPDLLLEIEPEHLARQGASFDAIRQLLARYGYRFGRPIHEAGEASRSAPGDRAPANLFASCRPDRLRNVEQID
jgi:FkbM family methyltransferase